MPYVKTTWVDRIVQFANRYTKANETSTSVDLTSNPGTVTTAGTPISAANLNKIEQGIADAAAKGDAALPKSGGTMTGAVNMGNQSITNVNQVDFAGGSSIDETIGQRLVIRAESDRFDIVTEDALNFILSLRYATDFIQFKNKNIFYDGGPGGNFAGNVSATGTVSASNSGGTKSVVMGTGATDVFMSNSVSGKFLQLKDDGTLAYNSHQILDALGNMHSDGDFNAGAGGSANNSIGIGGGVGARFFRAGSSGSYMSDAGAGDVGLRADSVANFLLLGTGTGNSTAQISNAGMNVDGTLSLNGSGVYTVGNLDSRFFTAFATAAPSAVSTSSTTPVLIPESSFSPTEFRNLGRKVYFEAVVKAPVGGSVGAALYNGTGSAALISGTQVTTGNQSYIQIRSGDISAALNGFAAGSIQVGVYLASGSGSASIVSARIIVKN